MLNIYLYLTKVLPALRRKYGHADWKVWSVELLCQVDEYIPILDMAKSNPWFYYYLKKARWTWAYSLMVFVFFMVYILVMGSRAF